jgi:hypothetical protein
METPMTDPNTRAVIGGNSPPDPIDTATALFGDVITEAENWLDGSLVETEAQMKAVDALIKGVKAARKAVDDARDESTRPLNEAWKAEIARWKPTQDDLDRIVKGLVGIVDGFKRKLAAEKAEAARVADAIARESADKARAAAMAADATNIEAARAADAMLAEAEELQKAAKAASKNIVKGMRTVTRHEVTDHGKLVNWINKHDKAALTAFIDEWARRNYKENQTADGLRVWTEQEAY